MSKSIARSSRTTCPRLVAADGRKPAGGRSGCGVAVKDGLGEMADATGGRGYYSGDASSHGRIPSDRTNVHEPEFRVAARRSRHEPSNDQRPERGNVTAWSEGPTGRPRVLFLDHTGGEGGGQLGMLRYLRQAPADIEYGVAFLEGGAIADQLQDLGIATHVLRSERRARWLFADVRRTRHIVRMLKPTIVVANSSRAALCVALSLLPVGRSVFYVREDLHRRSVGRLKAFVFGRVVIPRFGVVIANSRATRDGLPGRASIRSRAAVAYPVCGVTESDVGAWLRGRQSPARAGSTLRVLSLSRLQPWKGIDLLISAVESANTVPGVRVELTIAGGGSLSDSSYEAELRTQVARSSAPVRFVGHVDDVSSLLGAADVLGVCSKTPEPFGQVVVQAQSRGVVVVASALGGPREVILRGGGGILVPPGRPEGFAEAIVRLANDRQMLSALAGEALVSAKSFTDERTVLRLAEILRNASLRVFDHRG